MKNVSRHASRIAMAAMVVMGIGTSPASAEETIKITLATGLPAVMPAQLESNKTFAPAVNEALKKAGGKYKIAWTIAHGGSIVKLPAILKAISEGFIDIGITTQAVEPTKLALQSIPFLTPFGTTDHNIASEAFEDVMRQVPEMRQFDKYNLVYFGGMAFDRYILHSKFPIKSIDDLKGVKVGGIGPNLRWLEGTGAVGVIGNFGSMYNDIQSGKYDVTFATPVNSAAVKLEEVAPYIIDAGLGADTVTLVFFNKERWDKFPTEVQEALRYGFDQWRKAYMARLDRTVDASIDAMKKRGGKVIELTQTERKRWAMAIPPLAINWANRMEADGLPGRKVLSLYMDALRKRGVTLLREWDKE